MVAHSQAIYLITYSFHHTGQFVAQNNRGDDIRRTLVPMIDMHIRPANTAGRHSNQNFIRSQIMSGQFASFKGLIP